MLHCSVRTSVFEMTDIYNLSDVNSILCWVDSQGTHKLIDMWKTILVVIYQFAHTFESQVWGDPCIPVRWPRHGHRLHWVNLPFPVTSIAQWDKCITLCGNTSPIPKLTLWSAEHAVLFSDTSKLVTSLPWLMPVWRLWCQKQVSLRQG